MRPLTAIVLAMFWVSCFAETTLRAPGGLVGALLVGAVAALLPGLFDALVAPAVFRPDVTVAVDPLAPEARPLASAAQAVHAINPDVHITTLQQKADEALLDTWVPQASVVLDCSDNYTTRHAVNAACIRHGVPLVAGAVIRFDGQIMVFDPRDAASPCYACMFAPDAEFEEVQCSTMGVFAPLVGVIGAGLSLWWVWPEASLY